ncbi:MAG: zinc ribbon domain-containing protein [Proteobacteria bacterium]|nr:zinc ribbon domain-containing protein [Pseudomonadota bacterium]
MECPTCSMAVDAAWKFCPGCSNPLARACASCGKDLQAGWKACPFCGATVGAGAAPSVEPAAPTPTSGIDANVASQLAFDAWSKTWEEYGALHGASTTLAEIVAAQSADAIRSTTVHGMERALAALQELGVDTGSVRGPVAAAEIDLASLRAAEAAVHQLDVPESTAGGIWQGALNSVDPRHKSGQGAMIGATLGSVVPGLGTAIGAGVGAWVGQHMASSDDTGALERFDAAWQNSLESADTAFDGLWDRVAKHAGLTPLAKLIERNDAWLEVDANGPAVQAFIDQWGETADALGAMAVLGDDASRGLSATRLCELYPWRAESWEGAADAAILNGEPEDALAVCSKGLELAPEHVGLKLSRIRALAASGQTVRPTTEELGQPAAYLVEAEGHLDAGKKKKAIAALNALGEAMESRHAAAALARKVPRLAELGAYSDVGTGAVAEARGLVEQWLGSNGENTFMKLPRGERGRNARTEILGGKKGETVLWFYDWSMWGNGNNGLILTDNRLVWKCAFLDPESFPYDRLDPETIGFDETTLGAGDSSVDVEDEAIAEAVANVVFQLSSR